MSNQISSQANKLWQILSAPSTAATYQQALSTTWTIIKETGLLVWLILCLVLIAADWFWENSVGLGRKTRNWVSSFDSGDTGTTASQMGQELLLAGRSSLNYVLNQARAQLDLPAKPELHGSIASPQTSTLEKTSTMEPKEVNVEQVSPAEKKKVGEDEAVESTGGLTGTTSGSFSSVPSEKSEVVEVKEVSPAKRQEPGEDEEVPVSPVKES